MPLAVATNGTALGNDHFELLRRFTDRIVLVLGTVKNGGKARVFLGKRKLGVVKFAGKRSYGQLRTFDLGKARKGKLRVVVAKNKPVRIEGVAVVTGP